MTYQAHARATKVSHLIERLSSLTVKNLDEFELQRIKIEADSLLRARPSQAHQAHMVLGAVASLRGDAEAVRHHNGIALRYLGNEVDVWYNCSVSLFIIDEAIEAAEFARKAFELAPDDCMILEHLIKTTVASACFKEARDLCDRWDKSFPDRPVRCKFEARALASAVERGAFSEESVREILQIALDVQNAAKIRRVITGFLKDITEPDSFLCKLHVLTSPADAAVLNEQLADQIVARSELMDDPGFAFVPMFIGIQ